MDYYFMLGAALRRPKVVEEFDFDSDVRIGRGSYGQVYKVRNKEDGRYYAVKEVELSSFSPATHREIALYREINHPNVIDLLKVYFSYTAERAWLLFNYAEYDLQSIIKYYRGGSVPELQIPNIMKKSCLYQILSGLKYLHDSWIMHRDLKPDNIMVMGEGPQRGRVKIADMGLARTFHSPMKPLADIDTVVVTCWYRAPELMLGSRHYTKAIDIFSVGCIFGELLTYSPIFAAKIDTSQQPARTPYLQSQLDKIFSVVGFPTLTTWPELRHMPEYRNLKQDFRRQKYANSTLSKYMKEYSISKHDSNFQLLSLMLTLDPKKRISCEMALSHSYFFESPLPTEDVFSCFDTEIPYPDRKYLSRKVDPPKYAQKAKIPRNTHLQELNI